MRLLVCVDFSRLTDLVVAEAVSLARATRASVVLVHVAPTEPALTSGGVGPPGGHRVPPVGLEQARATLDEIADRIRELGVEVRAELRTTDGTIHDAILEEVEAHRATYVVIGSHGRAVVVEMLLGSTAHSVLRKARVPVLVVPDQRVRG